MYDDSKITVVFVLILYLFNMLKDKKILIGITGSIAAYKIIHLIRLLVKQEAEVRIVMTSAAKEFVSPVVLSTLSKNKVFVDLVEENSWSNHVALGRWADVFLIAPLSCNTLAKMANGLCDNLLLAVYLSATCPVVVAPAMDEDMWHHPFTKKNIETLKKYGNNIIPVDNGELASGLFGDGRMAEPTVIITYLIDKFFRGLILKNKKILITAGPTYEPLDPVRFIGNHSSGKMGFAIAEQAYLQGADVTLISGPTHEQLKYNSIKLIKVTTANEMYEACLKTFKQSHITIMSAAVADYQPKEFFSKKIKKNTSDWNLKLQKTTDILFQLGKQKKKNQFLVGFALETENEVENALQKLKNKNADAIVLNSLNDTNTGFGFDTNKITILYKDGATLNYDLKNKQDVAKDIISFITDKIHEK
jgi:phosphopantothenoylcysteine decarboxylase/phosphopantothenate--cysteine ligase